MSTVLASAASAEPAVLPATDAVVDRLRRAVDACMALLQRTAVEATTGSGDEVTWPTWELTNSGGPERCTGGRSTLYDGDAGIVWALQRLGSGLHRADVAALAERATAALGRRPVLPGMGLLSGRVGVDLVVGSGAETQSSVGVSTDLAAAFPCSDLTSGLAGALLALTRMPDASPAVASNIVDALWRRSERQLWGRGWPDHTQHGDEARPLCGMAHGASGIAWALAESAWRWPQLADTSLSLAAEALRFEAAWSDPLHGGWPDLRGAEPTWTARWCHGAAGAGAIRLRLLELSARGLEVPWQDEAIRAELEVAVQACGAEVWREREAWQAYGAAALGQGWTLCHGVGAPAAVLDLAATTLDEPAHRALALDAAADFLDVAGDDPSQWPCGLTGADGDLGLFNGIAGTATLFADMAGIASSAPAVLLG
ncbi:MAG TPA: lanthionine synthetase LanC family protein [Flexivirga sp.]|uniref:lanthionine synthetase LanC family protein n=1 Tax=Flexivirga sp. TaxID=1962927 RepID=UPI002C25F69F|nr:lanthionine synthetase LanC family protein [Flexivirga sp.]HWC22585.1 lanthionine synthetase LanC family protein [Flexivirga sp.]